MPLRQLEVAAAWQALLNAGAAINQRHEINHTRRISKIGCKDLFSTKAQASRMQHTKCSEQNPPIYCLHLNDKHCMMSLRSSRAKERREFCQVPPWSWKHSSSFDAKRFAEANPEFNSRCSVQRT